MSSLVLSTMGPEPIVPRIIHVFEFMATDIYLLVIFDTINLMQIRDDNVL